MTLGLGSGLARVRNLTSAFIVKTGSPGIEEDNEAHGNMFSHLLCAVLTITDKILNLYLSIS